jgi:hypothetical protein
MSRPENFPPNFTPLGYFKTLNTSTVSLSGENHPINYLRALSEDQYEYITKENNVKVFVSGDLISDPGKFELRVFYDKMN